MHSVEMFDPEHTVKMILIKGNDLVNTAQLRGKKKVGGETNCAFSIIPATSNLCEDFSFFHYKAFSRLACL